MSEPVSESTLSRIRGLLAKAESTEFPAEAEALTAKAAELIAKYGIDQALLKTDDGAPAVPGDRVIRVQAPYALDKAQLLITVAHRLGCKTVRQNLGNGTWRVHLFGFDADIERTEMLYTSLLVQQATAMAHAEIPFWETKTAAWKRSFMAGYTQAINTRLYHAEERAKQNAQQDRDQAGASGPSVALVLVDRKDQVEKAMNDFYPKLVKSRPRHLSGNGHREGRAAGNRANLGGTGIGSSPGSDRALSNG